jgi:dihydrofolate reductase
LCEGRRRGHRVRRSAVGVAVHRAGLAKPERRHRPDDVDRDRALDAEGQPGGDVHLSGGAKLAQTLVRLGLVDEYRFFVFPVYSPGATWYGELGSQKPLELISSTAFESGVVGLYYKPTTG